MNKKLLTIAIGAALASAPMFANAALTAYGKLNVGIASIDNGNNTPATEGNEIVVTDDASRLGFKGEEDLGGSLKALYMYEIGIDVDNGGDNQGTTGTGGIGLSQRDTYVGLGGGFGTLRIGQYNTAYKGVSIPTEIFGDTIADFTANNFSGESRQANNIGYTSPTFGGVKLGLEYSTGTETGLGATQRNPMNAAVTWSNNAFYVAAGYYDYDLLAAIGLSSAMKLSAMGTFGGFKIAATYEDQSADGNTVVVDTANLAGMFTMGNHQFALSYTMSMADANGTAVAPDADCTMYGAGYFYNLSKTQAVKLVYNKADNDLNRDCMGRMSGGNSSHSLQDTTDGNSPSGFQVMMTSSF
jgi:predicted porin